MDPSLLDSHIGDLSMGPIGNQTDEKIHLLHSMNDPFNNGNLDFSPDMPSKGPIILIPPSKNMRNGDSQTAAPAQKKGPWSEEEDQLLIEAMKDASPVVWDVIAAKVPGRSPIQCRERWKYRLKPGLNKSKFQRCEDVLILKEQRRLGNKWTLIANKLPGRTAVSVKNRWYLHLRHFKF